MKKTKIICVVGATASGKTALGVELAKAVGEGNIAALAAVDHISKL